MPSAIETIIAVTVAPPTIKRANKKRTYAIHSANDEMMEHVKLYDEIKVVFEGGNLKRLSDTMEWKGKKLSEVEWDKLLFSNCRLVRTKFAEAVGIPHQSYRSFLQYTHHDKTKRKKLGKVGRPRKQPEAEAMPQEDVDALETFRDGLKYNFRAMSRDDAAVEARWKRLQNCVSYERLMHHEILGRGDALIVNSSPETKRKWYKHWRDYLPRICALKQCDNDYLQLELDYLKECEETRGHCDVLYIGPDPYEPYAMTMKRRYWMRLKVERFNLVQVRHSLDMVSPGLTKLLYSIDHLLWKLDEEYRKLGYEEPTGLRWEVRKINHERIKNKKQKRQQHDVDDVDVESHPHWEDYRLRVLTYLTPEATVRCLRHETYEKEKELEEKIGDAYQWHARYEKDDLK